MVWGRSGWEWRPTIVSTVVTGLTKFVVDVSVTATRRLGVAPGAVCCAVGFIAAIQVAIVADFRAMLSQLIHLMRTIDGEVKNFMQRRNTYYSTMPFPHLGGFGFPHGPLRVQLELQ